MAFTMEFGTGFEMGQVPIQAGVAENVYGVTSIKSDNKHTGTYSIRIINAYNGCHYGFYRSTASNEVYMSFWINYMQHASLAPVIRFMVDETIIGYLRWDLDSYWDAYVNDVKVADGTVAVSPSTWVHIQIHYKCADVGVFETIIDGVPDITYNGDTKPSDSDLISSVRFAGTALSVDGYYLDDVAIGTGGWPGDIRFDAVLVDSDESVAWSRSAGTDNYALVDERPPSSIDYVYAQADVSDRYGTPGTWDDTDGLGNVVKTPVAVIAWADARKQSGNSDDKLQLTQGDGVNEADGGYESLLTSYENRYFIRETAPDGGAWTKAKVNALVVGIDADMA